MRSAQGEPPCVDVDRRRGALRADGEGGDAWRDDLPAAQVDEVEAHLDVDVAEQQRGPVGEAERQRELDEARVEEGVRVESWRADSPAEADALALVACEAQRSGAPADVLGREVRFAALEAQEAPKE